MAVAGPSSPCPVFSSNDSGLIQRIGGGVGAVDRTESWAMADSSSAPKRHRLGLRGLRRGLVVHLDVDLDRVLLLTAPSALVECVLVLCPVHSGAHDDQLATAAIMLATPVR